jgi:energy-coupling factor transporter ATP-binding protein EcfA2
MARGIQLTQDGIDLIRKRMEDLPKPNDPDRTGWTHENYEEASGGNPSPATLKRGLSGEPIDRKSIIQIAKVLGLTASDLVDPLEWKTSSKSKITDSASNTDLLISGIKDLFARQKERLSTNKIMAKDGITFQPDHLFVTLGLVESIKRPKVLDIDSTDRGSELYEPEREETSKEFEFQVFLDSIIRDSDTPKSQGKRIAVIGEPGAGKTTLLQQIGGYVQQTSSQIPLWISLADMGTKPLWDYLMEDFLKNAVGVLPNQEQRAELEQLLLNNQVYLLLDGVDEMSVPNALDALGKQLREGWATGIRVILTCRLNTWSSLENFDVYRTVGFDYPGQVHQFIDHFFNRDGSNPVLGERLKIELNKTSNTGIKDTTRSPLRLSLLCYIFDFNSGKLPDTKADLYCQFVQAFYDLKKEQIDIGVDRRNALNRALGKLAKASLDRVDSRFRLEESFIKDFLGDPQKEGSMFWQARQLGWLNEIGIIAEKPFDNAYAFLHPTFQEYFAATAIEETTFFLDMNQENTSLGSYRIFDSQWQEVILLWFGCQTHADETKSELCRKILEFVANESYPGYSRNIPFYSRKSLCLVNLFITEFKTINLDLNKEIYSHLPRYWYENREWKNLNYIREVQLLRINRDGLSKEEEKVTSLLININDKFALPYSLDPRYFIDLGYSDRKTLEEIIKEGKKNGKSRLDSLKDAILVLNDDIKNCDDWDMWTHLLKDLDELVTAMCGNKRLEQIFDSPNTTLDIKNCISKSLLNHGVYKEKYFSHILCNVLTEDDDYFNLTKSYKDLLISLVDDKDIALNLLESIFKNIDIYKNHESVYYISDLLNSITLSNTEISINLILKFLDSTTHSLEVKAILGVSLLKIQPGYDKAINLLKEVIASNGIFSLQCANELWDKGIHDEFTMKSLLSIPREANNLLFNEIKNYLLSENNIDNLQEFLSTLINIAKNQDIHFYTRYCLIDILTLENIFNKYNRATILNEIIYLLKYIINNDDSLEVRIKACKSSKNLKNDSLTEYALNALKNFCHKEILDRQLYDVAVALDELEAKNNLSTDVFLKLLIYSEACFDRSYIDFGEDNPYEGDDYPKVWESCFNKLKSLPRTSSDLKNLISYLNTEFLKFLTDSEHPKNKSTERVFKLLRYYAENMKYTDFYIALSFRQKSHPEIEDTLPSHNHKLVKILNNQIFSLDNSMSSRKDIHVITINLEELTIPLETQELIQRLCIKIYKHPSINIPGKPPRVCTPADLLVELFGIQEKLAGKNIVLICYYLNPTGKFIDLTPEALATCSRTVSAEDGFYLGVITSQQNKLPYPHRSFQPQQDKLSQVIQSWLNDLPLNRCSD